MVDKSKNRWSFIEQSSTKVPLFFTSNFVKGHFQFDLTPSISKYEHICSIFAEFFPSEICQSLKPPPIVDNGDTAVTKEEEEEEEEADINKAEVLVADEMESLDTKEEQAPGDEEANLISLEIFSQHTMDKPRSVPPAVKEMDSSYVSFEAQKKQLDHDIEELLKRVWATVNKYKEVDDDKVEGGRRLQDRGRG